MYRNARAQELADRVSVSRATLSRLENATRP
ncbi:helix-turn-helix domain-containing protein [Slackia sp.]